MCKYCNKENCNYENAEDVPETVMINPIWESLSDETDLKFEGCLSVPEIRGKVRRYKNIKVSSFYAFYTQLICALNSNTVLQC